MMRSQVVAVVGTWSRQRGVGGVAADGGHVGRWSLVVGWSLVVAVCFPVLPYLRPDPGDDF